jgi:uncharacterized membrane protein
LEARRLLSNSYTITDLGPLATDATSAGHPTVNNASVVQVAGQNSNDRAYLWDSVHGSLDLGTVGKDAESAATGINDSGQVVGLSYTETLKTNRKSGNSYYADTSLHAFLWTGAGGMQNIGNGNIPSGINSSGEVVGTLNNNQEAALWSRGHWTGLGTLGGSTSDGFGINDYGQAVGISDVPAPSGWTIQHAFLWTPTTPGGTTGTMTDLGALNNTLGFDTSGAYAINGQGLVTGETIVSNSGWYHAFVWAPSSPNGTTGTMTDLGALDGAYSSGSSINSSGTVVGGSTDGSAGSHAVIWQKGPSGYTMADLNTLIPAGTGWTLTSAGSINNNGQIVVEATNGSTSHTLLLTPTAPLAGAASLASGSNFGPATVLVPLAGAPPSAAPAGTASPAPLFAQAPLFVPPLTSNLPPTGPDTGSPHPVGTSAAADRALASLDAELSWAPVGEDLALLWPGAVPTA